MCTKDVKSEKFDSIALRLVILRFFFCFNASDSMSSTVDQLIWILIAHSSFIYRLKLDGIFDLILFTQDLLVVQFTRASIPEGHHVESVDSSKHVVNLLPDQVIIVET